MSGQLHFPSLYPRVRASGTEWLGDSAGDDEKIASLNLPGIESRSSSKESIVMYGHSNVEPL